MLCTGPNVLGSDYDTPPNAARVGGQLEFTCLLPERDTKRVAWVVSLTRGHLVVAQLMLWLGAYHPSPVSEVGKYYSPRSGGPESFFPSSFQTLTRPLLGSSCTSVGSDD